MYIHGYVVERNGEKKKIKEKKNTYKFICMSLCIAKDIRIYTDRLANINVHTYRYRYYTYIHIYIYVRIAFPVIEEAVDSIKLSPNCYDCLYAHKHKFTIAKVHCKFIYIYINAYDYIFNCLCINKSAY